MRKGTLRGSRPQKGLGVPKGLYQTEQEVQVAGELYSASEKNCSGLMSAGALTPKKEPFFR